MSEARLIGDTKRLRALPAESSVAYKQEGSVVDQDVALHGPEAPRAVGPANMTRKRVVGEQAAAVWPGR